MNARADFMHLVSFDAIVKENVLDQANVASAGQVRGSRMQHKSTSSIYGGSFR